MFMNLNIRATSLTMDANFKTFLTHQGIFLTGIFTLHNFTVLLLVISGVFQPIVSANNIWVIYIFV